MMRSGDLRGILKYVPQFRGAIFVVAVDGALIAGDLFGNILLDLAVLNSMNVKLILVHGASAQIQELARQRGIMTSSTDGIGVTDDTTLELAEEAIALINNHVLQQLTAARLRGAAGTFIEAHPSGIVRGRDLEHTGTVEKVDTGALHALLNADIVPVVSPLGYDEGRVLRLNSDHVAVAVAVAVKAAKILFLTTGGIKDSEGKRIPALTVDEARALAAKLSPEAESGTISSLQHAARACQGGVARVHIMDGARDEVVLDELFSNEGVGTMIHADDYEQIRPARQADIPLMMQMINPSVQDDELIPRSPKNIRANLGDYFLLETDGNPIGVVAVHLYAEHRMAELACLIIRPTHEGGGYGRRLVQFAEKKAKERGAERIIALSTKAWRFFQQKCGFQDATKEILPLQRRAKLESSGRNSRISLKTLV